MTTWVVKVTNEDHTWSNVDSVWSTELAARQRADYIHDNDDQFGDWWTAYVQPLEVDACTAWPRETRDR